LVGSEATRMAQVISIRTATPRRRRDLRFSLGLGFAVAVGLGIGSVVELPRTATAGFSSIPTEEAATVIRDFGACYSGGGTNCVVDGDTSWIDGEKVRIADIDAPETHPSRCAEEARLGDAATARLRALLNTGPVELVSADRDTDRYGRKLRIVMQNGRSVGTTLADEGLARRWEGRRRTWCDANA
jgi:micrococcal nuclease